jgi:hypothetical protein
MRGPAAAAVILALLLAGCTDGAGTAPSRPSIVIQIPSPVHGRYVTCAACTVPPEPVIVVDFPVAYPDRLLPPAGRLVLEAAAAFAPPPPRDEIVITVTVRLASGGEASASSPLVIDGADSS